MDAVAALLDAGAFEPPPPASLLDEDAADAGGGGQTAWALDFLATHLGDGRATASPATVMQVSALVWLDIRS